MTAGAFVPAAPIPTTSFNGWIDAPSGVPTLHVSAFTSSSLNTIASFTGR